MVSLTQDANGNYRARKRLPDDVRDEYKRRHGARYEAKFFAPASTKRLEVMQQHREWLNEVDGRISAIRAARDGTGQSLTPQQARKLAGEWYEWWIARHATASHRQMEEWRDAVQDAIYGGDVSEEDAERLDADELWRERKDVRESVRPVLADIGETAQFLATKRLALTNAARDLFLDYLYEDLSAALTRIIRLSEGDHSPDRYVERFPKSAEWTDTGISPWELFERWIAERMPADSTVESWRYVFRALGEHFKERSAASILSEEADVWVKGLITPHRSAATVKNTWLNAATTIFVWAVEHKHIGRNPFADVKVTVPRAKRLRETRAFHTQEWRTILVAATEISDTRKPIEAAKRWVPWLCAYNGARVGEMTQLRGVDVIERDGVHALRITPDAGTVKGSVARVVPLHEHLIAQGFLDFVRSRTGQGPLFYAPATTAASTDPTKQRKPRSAQMRQRLAAWVRELGVDDPNISPNHAWRHTFKQIADRAGITERTSDYITGHAHKSEGAKYGAPTVADMAKALRRFPRYKLK